MNAEKCMNREMYDEKCEEKFSLLQRQIDALKKEDREDRSRIKKVLFGNGDEGIVDTVRNHKRYFRCMWAIGIFVVSLIAVQTAIAVRSHYTDDTTQQKLTVLLEKVQATLDER